MFRRGPAEVGLAPTAGRRSRRCRPGSTAQARHAPARPGDVVVITGGARGITAEVGRRAGRGVPADARPARPQPRSAASSPTGSSRWPTRPRSSGRWPPGPTAMPRRKPIGEQFRGVAANREIPATCGGSSGPGRSVVYRPVDVRDAGGRPRLPRRRPRRVRADPRPGPRRGGARRPPDRGPDRRAVRRGLRHQGRRPPRLARGAVGPTTLRVLVLFSSSTARFGRTGQVAYAVANEVLNKHARREARSRPACRVVAVNWGPWDGGMVTPSLRPLFEAEGVALIPPEAGARYLVEEIRDAAAPAGRGRRPRRSWCDSDPDDQGRGNRQDVVPPGPAPSGQGVEVPAGLGPAVAPVFERPVDESVAAGPQVARHRRPARAADGPDPRVAGPGGDAAATRVWSSPGVDDLRLLKGVVLRDATPETVRVLAARLYARRRALPRARRAARGGCAMAARSCTPAARSCSADRHPQPEPAFELPSLPPYPAWTRPRLYRDVLFHGPDLQGLERVEGCGDAGDRRPGRRRRRRRRPGSTGRSARRGCPTRWPSTPPSRCWSSGASSRSGVCSLPTYLGRYRQFRRAFPPGPIRIVARITHAGAHRARADVDFLAADGGLIARIDDYECVLDASLNQAFRRSRPARAERR